MQWRFLLPTSKGTNGGVRMLRSKGGRSTAELIGINSMLDTCEHIASSPENIRQDYDYIRPHLHGISCGHHIIFFRIISQNKVRIIRILHEKMDFPRHF